MQWPERQKPGGLSPLLPAVEDVVASLPHLHAPLATVGDKIGKAESDEAETAEAEPADAEPAEADSAEAEPAEAENVEVQAMPMGHVSKVSAVAVDPTHPLRR